MSHLKLIHSISQPPIPNDSSAQYDTLCRSTLARFERTVRLVQKNRPSLVKRCALVGLVLAEVYMVFTVASPRLKGIEIPAIAVAMRIMAMSLLFGPFGLAVGTGVGLLLEALRRSFNKTQASRTDKTSN